MLENSNNDNKLTEAVVKFLASASKAVDKVGELISTATAYVEEARKREGRR